MHRPLASRRIGALPLLLAVLAAAAVGLFLLLYAASRHAFLPDSDGATVVLEGWAMLHGHLLLGHWAISLDSFWTVDALWYMGAVAVVGIEPALMHAVPAAIATAVVVLGVVMAVEGRRKVVAAVIGGVVVVAILALPSEAWANFFLRGPWHIGTALWCLVAFLALRRGRFGVGFAVAVVFMAAGMLGDLQMLALGVVPVLVAGLAAMGRTRSWRAGIVQVTAAVSAVVLWEVVRKAAKAIGTFSIAAANPTAGFHRVLSNVKHGLHEAVLLLGAGSSYYGLGGVPRGLSYVHLAAVLLIGLAGLAAIVSIVWGVLAGGGRVLGAEDEAAWRLDDMLVLGGLASFAAFILLATAPDPTYARYLAPGIIFATILAGREVARLADRPDWGLLGRLVAAAGLAVTCCFAAGVALDLEQPAPVSPSGALASFLEAHHLDRGVGAYWSASITTVASDGRVEVRPVFAPHGRIVRWDRNSANYWYDRPFEFLVFEPSAPWGGVSATTAVATFGQPRFVYTVDSTYEVLVWAKPIRVPPGP